MVGGGGEACGGRCDVLVSKPRGKIQTLKLMRIATPVTFHGLDERKPSGLVEDAERIRRRIVLKAQYDR